MEPQGSPPQVLIVDDERDVLESTAMLVESIGYEPITLSDPAQVLETAEREQPAVLLQDLNMPDLNLSGLVAVLRLSPATDDMPIVFVSAREDVSDHATRYDAWDYLSKPFGKEELDRVLEEAIHGGPPTSDREPREEVRRLFHDQWNLLAAIGNYIDVMRGADEMPADVQQSVEGLEKTVLQLEARTERTKAYLMAVLAHTEARPGTSESREGTGTLAEG
jgi:FixJ family two-component response regulator